MAEQGSGHMRPNAKAHEHISAILFTKQNGSLQIQNEVCEKQVEVPQKDRHMIAEKLQMINNIGKMRMILN